MVIVCDKERLIEINANNDIKYLINVDKLDGKHVNEIGIRVQKNGIDVGYAPILNFIQGDNIILTITEDVSNNRININITSL